MPLGDELTRRVLGAVDPGPRPTHHDDTGHAYMLHDAYQRASALGPPLCEALDRELGPEHPVDAAVTVEYKYEALRPWERLTVLVRTSSAVVLGTMRSKRQPEVHRFAIGELEIARTRNPTKTESELDLRDGRPVLVLGRPRWGGADEDRRAEFERVAGVGAQPAAALPPPGWHPDPTGRRRLRWWDGQRWTAHAADDGGVVSDPV